MYLVHFNLRLFGGKSTCTVPVISKRKQTFSHNDLSCDQLLPVHI